MRTRYANRPEDPEAIPELPVRQVVYSAPAAQAPKPQAKPSCPDWPFDAEEAKRRQQAGGELELAVEIAPDLGLEMVLIPAGQFVMGSANGVPDESPQAQVSIDRPFYMACFETTNAQFAAYDPRHDSGFISVYNKDVNNQGEAANRERQPVVRVTWNQAMDFCRWISSRTGRRFALPTEAQWEYACRAGTDTAMAYGGCDRDFGRLANLADLRVDNLCRRDSPPWIPSIDDVDDGSVVSNIVGQYTPNAFGLYDMHGNVAEWTRSTYRPYPYDSADGRDSTAAGARRVINDPGITS